MRAHLVHDFTAETGPNHNLPPNSPEEDFFYLFFDDDFFALLASETNKYSAHVQKKNNKVDKAWKDVTVDEMKNYIGIVIYMGIVKLPTIKMYFNSDFVVCPDVKNTMSFKRYQKITQYLHLSDDTNQTVDPKSDDYDILFKVRPCLEIIKLFKKYYNPGCELSVDEAMIAFRGRLIFKQYMSSKPTKWGIKAWAICDSKKGYLLDAQIYTGKKEKLNNDFLLGEQVVLHLAREFFNKYHHIYFDNLFSSVRLMKIL